MDKHKTQGKQQRVITESKIIPSLLLMMILWWLLSEIKMRSPSSSTDTHPAAVKLYNIITFGSQKLNLLASFSGKFCDWAANLMFSKISYRREEAVTKYLDDKVTCF
jgi:hypothetical protein